MSLTRPLIEVPGNDPDDYDSFGIIRHDDQFVDESLINRTVKHLQVLEKAGSIGERRLWVKVIRRFFVALEVVVILKPEYCEIRVDDFKRKTME